MNTLVIGCCTLDLAVSVPRMPAIGEDVNTRSLHLALGGMAYNVYNAMQLLGAGCILGAPIGEGQLASLTARLLHQRGQRALGTLPGTDNGLCLCLVDDTGERSFISHHGAEYRFDPALFEGLDFAQIDRIYASGLELEDADGGQLLAFLEAKQKPLLFAPGPRLEHLSRDALARVLALGPLLHLNQREARLLTGSADVPAGAAALCRTTGSPVVVTLGSGGTYLQQPGQPGQLLPVEPVPMVDATGAGDNHAGTVLAGLNRGLPLVDAVRAANVVSGWVVRQPGASLTPETLARARPQLAALGLVTP